MVLRVGLNLRVEEGQLGGWEGVAIALYFQLVDFKAVGVVRVEDEGDVVDQVPSWQDPAGGEEAGGVPRDYVEAALPRLQL